MDNRYIAGAGGVPEVVEYEEVLDDGQYIDDSGAQQDYGEYVQVEDNVANGSTSQTQFYYERVIEEKPSPLCTTIANFGKTRDVRYSANYYNQHMVRPSGTPASSIRPITQTIQTRQTLGFPRPKIASVSFYTPPSLLTPKREQIIGGNHPFSPTFLHLFPSNKAPKPAKIRKISSKKKPCNCNKSMCLKLYCDCFANGEFCLDCNCKDCHNNLEHEAERSRAIKSSLERNPAAFKPKIGVAAKPTGKTVDMERLHQRGCHCKRSNCLKNYCECFEAKVPCTERCKCQSCRNTEHDRHNKFKDKFSTTAGGLAQLAAAAAADNRGRHRSRSVDSDFDASDMADGEEQQQKAQLNPKTQPWYYMTEDVIEATTMCLVSQAQEYEHSMDEEELERNVLKEFGRCLEQVIESSSSCLPQNQHRLLDTTTTIGIASTSQ